MKIRNGFVSNSSSSSFMVPRRYVSEYQLERIIDHIPELDTPCEKPGVCKMNEWGHPNKDTCGTCTSRYYNESDRWEIRVVDDKVCGYTMQDNFSMMAYLGMIGVPMEKVSWGDFYEYTNEDWDENP